MGKIANIFDQGPASCPKKTLASDQIVGRIKQDRAVCAIAVQPCDHPVAPIMVGPAIAERIALIIKANKVAHWLPGAFKALLCIAPNGAAAGKEGFNAVPARVVMSVKGLAFNQGFKSVGRKRDVFCPCSPRKGDKGQDCRQDYAATTPQTPTSGPKQARDSVVSSTSTGAASGGLVV